MNNYKYDLGQCDVEDKEKCKKYRKKRVQWLFCLSGTDLHSISNQLSSLIWDYALFCTVNELRKISIKQPEEGVGFNTDVLRMLDVGFVTTQAMAIRKLTEWQNFRRNRRIISIRSILEDIKKNYELITRENYICYDGLPYSCEGNNMCRLIPKKGVSCTTLPLYGTQGYYMAERMHGNFDKLAKVKPENRNRNDFIDKEILKKLFEKLNNSQDIVQYANKFIAHSAAPENRKVLDKNKRIMTLENLESSLKILYQVASFISSSLLWDTKLGGVPIPQYDLFESFDKKWASSLGLKNGKKKWDEVLNKVENWGDSSSIILD